MSEFYSRGIWGEVYRASPREHRWFPHADLVKLDPNLESPSTTFATKFYEHVIANLLFPENFIKVVGSRQDKSTHKRFAELLNRLLHITITALYDQRYRIYSEEAEVDPVHAIYSAHMQEDYRGVKTPCGCNICHNHNLFHQSLIEEAHRISQKTAAYGIFIPYSDPSDYCVDKGGRIIFFEIDDLKPQTLITQLQTTGIHTNAEKHVLALTKRYQALLS